MKQPKKPQPPKRHTLVYLKGIRFDNAYCTSCHKRIPDSDINKRCKGRQS